MNRPDEVASYPAMPTVSDLVADLILAFPLDRIESGTGTLYRDKLKDIPIPLLEAAIHDLICTAERFPKISQIKAAAAERDLELPSETEALAQIEARIRWRHGPEPRGPAPPFCAEVREALNHVGGLTAWRETAEPTIIRGQFARYYREIRAERIHAFQTSGLPRRPELSSPPQAAVS